jgi:hypothetical protein
MINIIFRNNRLEKLQRNAWSIGANLPPHMKLVIDDKDKKYYDDYLNIINKYAKTQSFINMDLNKDLTPPKDLYIEVRAINDIGVLNLKDGNSLFIKKNCSYLMKRSDVEDHIRNGNMSINE